MPREWTLKKDKVNIWKRKFKLKINNRKWYIKIELVKYRFKNKKSRIIRKKKLRFRKYERLIIKTT